MIPAHDFAQKQLELTGEFAKYVFDHPDVDACVPDGTYVYFEVAGEEEFNDYGRELAQRRLRDKGTPIVLVRVQGLAPPQGSRLIAPVIDPISSVA